MDQGFAEKVNQGSLNKLAEKTADGIMNRFGPAINLELQRRQFAGEYEQVELITNELLQAMLPVIANSILARFGYESSN